MHLMLCLSTLLTLVFVALTQHFIQSTMRCENCIDSVNIDSIDGMVEKPSVSAFQNFLQIENPLNIKKVMGRNVWMCFDSSIDSLNKHSIQCIACFDLCIDSVDKQDTILNTQ